MVCMIDGLILMILSVYMVSWNLIEISSLHCFFLILWWRCHVMYALINKIILLSDLECDFLNTKQGCKKLNQVKSSVVRFVTINLFWLIVGSARNGCHVCDSSAVFVVVALVSLPPSGSLRWILGTQVSSYHLWVVSSHGIYMDSNILACVFTIMRTFVVVTKPSWPL